MNRAVNVGEDSVLCVRTGAFERAVNACIAFAKTDRRVRTCVRTPVSRSQIHNSQFSAFERGRASSNAIDENCVLG